MIRYRYGLSPLTPRDLFANNIAAAFDWESDPHLEPPALPTPAHVISTACSGSTPVDTGGAGVDTGSLVGSPPGSQLPGLAVDRPKPHDLQSLLTSGYLGAARLQIPAGDAGAHVPPPVEAGDARVKALVRAAAVLAFAAAVPAAVSAADSFTPVRLTVDIAPVARLHAPLAVTVHVRTDPSVLDTRTAPLRIRVELGAGVRRDVRVHQRRGAARQATTPQPAAGKPYSAVAHGAGGRTRTATTPSAPTSRRKATTGCSPTTHR